MIEIKITANTPEEARKTMLDLIGGDPTVALAAEINKDVSANNFVQHLVQEGGLPPAPQTEAKPATRSRAKQTPPATLGDTRPEGTLTDPNPPLTVPSADPLATNGTPAPSADPLSGTPAPPSNDPLTGTPAPSSDPLTGTPPPAVPVTTSATTNGTPITLQSVREKIGSLVDYKAQVKSVLSSFKKPDGTACEKPSDLQEKDYGFIMDELNAIK